MPMFSNGGFLREAMSDNFQMPAKDANISMRMSCSIIICTRNRAEMLKKTLLAFQRVVIPQDMQVEMILVDNGSSDHTKEVIDSAKHPQMAVRGLTVSVPGKSRALNAAIASAAGEVLLFTDDDVEPASNWIENMARPLLEMRSDAVTGSVSLGEELRRPWLSTFHGVFLAWTTPAECSPDLIGASMGIRRSVFDVIGPFDENLGPGASGFGEEALLCRQIRELGLRIHPVHDSQVVHHPEASRLLRRSWLVTAENIGKSEAYIMHHWEHARIQFPAVRETLLRMKLSLRRLVQGNSDLNAEGCAVWEISYLIRIATLRHFARESRKPRNFPFRGLSGRTFESA